MTHTYKTKDVCSTEITFDLADGTVTNIRFKNGCPGNLKAVSVLCNGKRAEEIVTLLAPIRCGRKKSSCAHQLSLAVTAALEEQAKNA